MGAGTPVKHPKHPLVYRMPRLYSLNGTRKDKNRNRNWQALIMTHATVNVGQQTIAFKIWFQVLGGLEEIFHVYRRGRTVMVEGFKRVIDRVGPSKVNAVEAFSRCDGMPQKSQQRGYST
jgi:hypothetical protein